MDALTFFMNQAVLFIIAFGSFCLLVYVLRKHPCGDTSSRCGLDANAKSQIAFCSKEKKYWKRKRKRYQISGESAAILATILELGDKNFALVEDELNQRSPCSSCGMQSYRKFELDRAVRSYTTAKSVAQNCVFLKKYRSVKA